MATLPPIPTTSGVELNAMIANEIFGTELVCGRSSFVMRLPGATLATHIPPYSSDIAAAYAMEDEIERRGLEKAYAFKLVISCDTSSPKSTWNAIHASPLDRCRAPLATVRARKKQISDITDSDCKSPKV